MNDLKYLLSNGKVVNTYKEAIASGLQYSAFLKPVDENTPITKERQAIIKSNGGKYPIKNIKTIY